MPGFPVHHHLLEFAQIHVHWVGDATKPSHPLLSPSPPSFGLSQHQGLFLGISSSHQVAKVLEPQLQHQSFQWIYRVDFLYDWPVWAPCCLRTLKILLQHHSSKASILRCSAFFMVQIICLVLYVYLRDQGIVKNGRDYVTGNSRQYWWTKNPDLEPLLWRAIKWKYFQPFQWSWNSRKLVTIQFLSRTMMMTIHSMSPGSNH